MDRLFLNEDDVLEDLLSMEEDFTVGFNGEEVPDWSDTFLLTIFFVIDAPICSQLSGQMVHSSSTI